MVVRLSGGNIIAAAISDVNGGPQAISCMRDRELFYNVRLASEILSLSLSSALSLDDVATAHRRLKLATTIVLGFPTIEDTISPSVCLLFTR